MRKVFLKVLSTNYSTEISVDLRFYCKGAGSWASHGNNNKPWGGRWALPYHIRGTAKSRPGSRWHQTSKREEEEQGKSGALVALPELDCLATCTTCVNLSMGVVSTPQIDMGLLHNSSDLA